MADYQALKAELAKEGYQGKSDQEAADLLNAPGANVYTTVSSSQLLIFGTITGALRRIEAGMSHANDVVASACIAISKQIAKEAGSLDLSDPLNRQSIDLLVSVNILTAQNKTDLLALGTTAGPSIAVEVFGADVTNHDVAHARSL